MSSSVTPSDDVVELHDDAQIMALLGRDPAWTAYAVSDLDPPFREHSRFFGNRRGDDMDALVLLFRTPGFVSMLPYGTADGVRALLQSLPDLPNRFFVAIGEEHLTALEERFHLDLWWMYRMALAPSDLVELKRAVSTRRLTPQDLEAVEALYGHWESTFFQPMLLQTGLYLGVYDGDRLVSIAGTHTRSPRFHLATIGGVFTHPEYRGQGLAKAVTSAVAQALIDEGSELLVLNVKQDNAPALAAYRALGFRIHRPYLEGHAARQE